MSSASEITRHGDVGSRTCPLDCSLAEDQSLGGQSLEYLHCSGSSRPPVVVVSRKGLVGVAD